MHAWDGQWEEKKLASPPGVIIIMHGNYINVHVMAACMHACMGWPVGEGLISSMAVVVLLSKKKKKLASPGVIIMHGNNVHVLGPLSFPAATIIER